MRDKVINNKNFIIENTWMNEYDYDLRDEALRDLLHNIKTNMEKGDKFEIKYKTKKMEKVKNESLSVLAKKWGKKNTFYSSIFNSHVLKSSEIIPKELNYTSRLVKTPTNKYFLTIPKPLEIVSENQARNKMLFIDPGVKTFITGYDPSGKIVTIGEKDIGRIARLLHYKRKLQRKLKLEKNHSNKYNKRKAFLKMNEKITNLVEDMHKKTSAWLCKNYEHIFISRLNFHNCKKLNKRSKEKMASLRHCSFVDRLKYKSRETKSYVYEINEAYTSKTCSNCGNIKEDLKNKDTYECKKCNIMIGRDINASKNIMLRYFTKRAILVHPK
ncbi:hypothetical protein EB077_01455 [bacterium]|nr:hypothetical protein [bacterium]NDC93966.1 hypothetical protein [bacterium]